MSGEWLGDARLRIVVPADIAGRYAEGGGEFERLRRVADKVELIIRGIGTLRHTGVKKP
jgi:hypothetical protein